MSYTMSNIKNRQKAGEQIKYAKQYATYAREQTNMMSSVMAELKNQIKASNTLKQTIDQKLSDDTDVYLYQVAGTDAFGRVQGELYGNGLLTFRSYDPITQKLVSIQTGKGDDILRNLQYTYDDMDNVLTRNDTVMNEYESYTYDEYDRLSTWHNDGKVQQYSYDIHGNMLNNSFNPSMSYNDRNQIVSKTDNNLKKHIYSYDANGNILNDGTKQLFYTKFNKLKTIQQNGETTTLKYDSFNRLVEKSTKDQTIYYISKEYEYIKTKDKIQTRHNILHRDNIVAVHTKTLINNKKQVDTTQYIHTDALNSTDTVTNSKGKVVLRQRYTPYGAIRDTYNPNQLYPYTALRGYTGHRHHYKHSLINMNGRTYDSTISRFTSADPYVHDPTNSQSFNRYAYVMNNPLKYTDPSGYYPESAEDETADNERGGDGGSDNSFGFTDDYGRGTVTYDDDGNHNVSYDDGSGFGHDNGLGYSHDSDGQYATENYETGEISAGWDTGSYNQSSNGIETFTDSAINYHTVGYKNKTIETTAEVVTAVNIAMDVMETPMGRISAAGAIGGIIGAVRMTYAGPAGMVYGFTFGLASGLTTGVFFEATGIDITRITKFDVVKITIEHGL